MKKTSERLRQLSENPLKPDVFRHHMAKLAVKAERREAKEAVKAAKKDK